MVGEKKVSENFRCSNFTLINQVLVYVLLEIPGDGFLFPSLLSSVISAVAGKSSVRMDADVIPRIHVTKCDKRLCVFASRPRLAGVIWLCVSKSQLKVS